jgi:glutathione S-transferase
MKLYYFPSNASLAPHILLEEMGVPFELMLVDRATNMHKSANYIKLNPAGVIPTLVDGEVIVTETAAIMLHIADRFPEKNMLPPLQSAARAQCYRWLMYLTNTVQAEFLHFYYPDRHGGDYPALQEAVKQRAAIRLGEMFDILETQMAASDGAFFLGEQMTVVDVFLFMMCRWTRFMENPARSRPHLNAFLEMMVARPNLARVLVREELPKPWY